MTKRLAVVLILSGMILHCASRIGFLSYVYQQRHEIAYSLGLIDEMPIAMCSHDYDVRSGLASVYSSDEAPGTFPPSILQAKEINLYHSEFSSLVTDPSRLERIISQSTDTSDPPYAAPALSIFHPPCC